MALDSAVGRTRTYKRLQRRNRTVAVLRWAVPGVGLAVAGALIVQIVLGNIAQDFGISAIRVEAGRVVIEAPRYGGVTGEGMRYDITAEEAFVDMNDPDLIDLIDAVIVTRETDGSTMTGRAQTASLDLGAQQVTVEGEMTSEDSDGTKGRFQRSLIDWPSQTLTSEGPVRLEFTDGAVLEAATAVYDANARQWDFGPTVFTHPGDEGGDGEDENDI